MRVIKETVSQVQRLMDEWDEEKNKEAGIDSAKLGSQSNTYAFWKCNKCGYRWRAKISNRYNGRGCPCCARKVVVPGINDLATTHPKLAQEWDYERNGDLTPDKVLYGTAKRVYWLCPEGHSYSATINHRSGVNGTCCPKCNSGRQTSFAEQAFFFYIKKVFPDAISRYTEIFTNGMEIDIYIPSIKLGIEYDGEAWHKKDKRKREQKKYAICKENGIYLLRVMEKPSEESFLIADETLSLPEPLYEHKYLARGIRVLLDRIDPSCNIWTRKDIRQVYSDVDINIERDEREIRAYMTKLRSGSLQELYPDVAAEWHPHLNGTVTPDKVKPGSDYKAVWICKKCGNIYRSVVGHRTGKHPTGCPKCGVKKVIDVNRKAVKMLDPKTGDVMKIFPSISEASRQMRISNSNISSVCKNKRAQAGGYGWEYV